MCCHQLQEQTSTSDKCKKMSDNGFCHAQIKTFVNLFAVLFFFIEGYLKTASSSFSCFFV